MSAQKVAIVVLVLIAVLFATGILAGHNRKDDQSTDAGWVAFLRGLLPAQSKVAPGEINGPCFIRGSFQISAGVPCVVEIAPSKSVVRTLSLSLTTAPILVPARMNVDIGVNDKSKDALSMTASLRGANDKQREAELKIMKEGASVTLTCMQSIRGQCVVTMQ